MTVAAIIGCGAVGQRHAHNFRRLGYDVRTWDINPERCTVPERNDALEGAAVAVVATPPGSHVAETAAALAAGVPWILVEKPLAVSSEVAEGFRGYRICVGYCLRFALATQYLREAVQRIRPIYLVEAVYAEAPTNRPAWLSDPVEGGVLLEYSHILDLLHWIIGPIAEIQSEVVGVPETAAVATLRWHDGAVGTLRMDFYGAPETRLKVIGAGGTVEWLRDRITGPGCDELFRENPAAWLLHEAQELHALRLGAIASSDRLCTVGEGIVVLQLIERIRQKKATV